MEKCKGRYEIIRVTGQSHVSASYDNSFSKICILSHTDVVSKTLLTLKINIYYTLSITFGIFLKFIDQKTSLRVIGLPTAKTHQVSVKDWP